MPNAVWPVFFTGLTLSLSLIVAIGAQNAFVLRQGLRREHVLPVVAFCALADAVLISAGVLGMAQALGSRPALAQAMALAGAVFLAWYGWQALQRARRAGPHAPPRSGSLPPEGADPAWGGPAPDQLTRGAALAQAAAFTLLNPHVYLDTVLLVGSIGAQQPAGLQGWFIGGASIASLGWFTALGFGARWLGACAAEGASAATRDKPVSCGTTACAQGSTLGLSVAPHDPRFSRVSLRRLLPRRLLAPLFARPRAWQVLDGLIGLTMWVLAALLLRHALAPAGA